MNMANRKLSRPPKTVLNLYSYNVSNIVIVGDREIRRKIHRVEKDFNVTLVFCEPSDLKNSIDNKTIAIVIDEKKVKPKAQKYLEKTLKGFQSLPVFYLARSLKKSNFYTSLYEKGLQGVINWPGEASILHELIVESLRPHPKAVGNSKGDEKLSEIIKSHLILSGNYKSVKVKVIQGFAFLSGNVKTLFDKKTIESECSNILGVKKVIVKNIKIKKMSKVTDRDLERKLTMYMGHILGDNRRSISVKVLNKVVTLMGNTSSHGDVLTIEEFAMKQPSVQDVVRLVKYKPSLVSKNVEKAKLLEKEIKSTFAGVKHITINIYGEYADVSGTVKDNKVKDKIGKYLLYILPIKKVINKLFLSGKQ